MGDFKLGRLKFVWKGAWQSGVSYVKDDVIRYGGKSYVAVVGHTSNADFYIDLNNPTSLWSLMTDGMSWKGDWQQNTTYKINDIVKVGANEYICVVGHLSGNSSSFTTALNAGHWQLFVSGMVYRGTWHTATSYAIGELVKYGASVYKCSENHTSQQLLEDDSLKWSVFVSGVKWVGEWAAGIPYTVGDLVKNGPDQYICTITHTAGVTIDMVKFELYGQGITLPTTYDVNTSYAFGDIVTFAGYAYSSTQNANIGNAPGSNSSYWNVVTTGSNGTVTSVSGSGPISVATGTSTPVISIATANTTTTGALSSTDWNTFNDKLSTFSSQTANFVYASPNGSAGTPTFRALVAADVPTLNQNTTGSAATATNIASGAANQLLFQTAANTTSFITAPSTTRTYLVWNGSAFSWSSALPETKVAMSANDINLSSGTFFTKTISGAATLTVSNVAATGLASSFILELTNGGSATVTWWSGMKWASGTAPTLTSSGVDILGFYTLDNGTTWRGLVLAKDSK